MVLSSLHNHSPSSCTQKLSIQGFADNLCALVSHPNPPVLFELGSADIQLWENLLFSAGGKLKHAKCFLFVILWGFTTSGSPFLIPPPPNCLVSIHNPSTNQDVTIEQVNAYASHTYLRALISPRQSSQPQQVSLMQLAASFVHNLRNFALSRAKTIKAYSAVYLPSIL